jgi:hypothetical protein
VFVCVSVTMSMSVFCVCEYVHLCVRVHVCKIRLIPTLGQDSACACVCTCLCLCVSVCVCVCVFLHACVQNKALSNIEQDTVHHSIRNTWLQKSFNTPLLHLQGYYLNHCVILEMQGYYLYQPLLHTELRVIICTTH